MNNFMKKKNYIVMVIMFLLLISGCTNYYNSDIKYAWNDEAQGWVITGYTGASDKIEVPRKIIKSQAIDRRDDVVGFGKNAFKDSKVKTIVLHDNITYIGDGAFQNAEVVGEFDLTNATYIGENAFDNTKLTKLSFSEKLVTAKKNAISASEDVKNTLVISLEMDESDEGGKVPDNKSGKYHFAKDWVNVTSFENQNQIQFNSKVVFVDESITLIKGDEPYTLMTNQSANKVDFEIIDSEGTVQSSNNYITLIGDKVRFKGPSGSESVIVRAKLKADPSKTDTVSIMTKTASEPTIVLKDDKNQNIALDATLTLRKGAVAKSIIASSKDAGDITWTLEGTNKALINLNTIDSNNVSVNFNTGSSNKNLDKNPASGTTLGYLIGRADGSSRTEDIKITLNVAYDDKFELTQQDGSALDETSSTSIYENGSFIFKIKESNNAYPALVYTISNNAKDQSLITKEENGKTITLNNTNFPKNEKVTVTVDNGVGFEKTFNIDYVSTLAVITDKDVYTLGDVAVIKIIENPLFTNAKITFNPSDNVTVVDAAKGQYKIVKSGPLTINAEATLSTTRELKTATKDISAAPSKEPTINLSDDTGVTIENNATIDLKKGAAAKVIRAASEDAGKISWTIEDDTSNLISFVGTDSNNISVSFKTPAANKDLSKNPLSGTTLGYLIGKADGSSRSEDIRIKLTVSYDNSFKLTETDGTFITDGKTNVDYIYGSNGMFSFAIDESDNAYPEITYTIKNNASDTSLISSHISEAKGVTLENAKAVSSNQEVTITVSSDKSDENTSFTLRYVAPLKITTDKDTYTLGDTITIKSENNTLLSRPVISFNPSDNVTAINTDLGQYKVVKTGPLAITATASLSHGSEPGDKTVSKNVDVTYAAATGIEFVASPYRIRKGASQEVSVKVLPENADQNVTVQFSSDTTDVSLSSASGLKVTVTGEKVTAANAITANLGSFSATANVEVFEKKITAITSFLSKKSVEVADESPTVAKTKILIDLNYTPSDADNADDVVYEISASGSAPPWASIAKEDGKTYIVIDNATFDNLVGKNKGATNITVTARVSDDAQISKVENLTVNRPVMIGFNPIDPIDMVFNPEEGKFKYENKTIKLELNPKYSAYDYTEFSAELDSFAIIPKITAKFDSLEIDVLPALQVQDHLEPVGTVNINIKKDNSKYGDSIVINKKRYEVADLNELKALVAAGISTKGKNVNLNELDVSNVTSMESLFKNSEFDGDISRWNTSKVTNMNSMFDGSKFTGLNGTINTQVIGSKTYWDVSKVILMEGMFRNSIFNQSINLWQTNSLYRMTSMFENAKFNQNINTYSDGTNTYWDVKNVIVMNSTFAGDKSEFNQPINNWDVSHVLEMVGTFRDNKKFTGDLSTWNTESLLIMNYIFANSIFNGDISNWKVGKVYNMVGIFLDNKVFSPATSGFTLNNWNVSKVTDFSVAFSGATNFNDDLSNWRPGAAVNMQSMFAYTRFNSDISKWTTDAATNMGSMFIGNKEFSPSLSGFTLNGWNMSKVWNITNMFSGATKFNDDLSSWQTGSVTLMTSAFNSTKYNGDMSSWDVSKVTNMNTFLYGATDFDQDLSSWQLTALEAQRNPSILDKEKDGYLNDISWGAFLGTKLTLGSAKLPTFYRNYARSFRP